MRHWDGSKGWLVDLGNDANFPILEAIETKVRDYTANGVRTYDEIDMVEVGFGLLQENNFGINENGVTEVPPWSDEAMLKFYRMMKRVWGRKLSICWGGMFGDEQNKAWTWRVLEMIYAEPDPPRAWFNDSYGQETRFTKQRQLSRGIWIIGKTEVTGGCNMLHEHKAVRFKPPGLFFDDHVKNRFCLFHNMGCDLDRNKYPYADRFIEETMAYLPERVGEWRAYVWEGENGNGGDGGGPIDPPPGTEKFFHISIREGGFITKIETVPGEELPNADGATEYDFISEHHAKVYVLYPFMGLITWKFPSPSVPYDSDHPERVTDGPRNQDASWFRTNGKTSGTTLIAESVNDTAPDKPLEERVEALEEESKAQSKAIAAHQGEIGTLKTDVKNRVKIGVIATINQVQ
jgi:hypothetical protein